MNSKVNWPNWVALAGVAWLASSVGTAGPLVAQQGGLTVQQWLETLAPLLAFVPKLIDVWKRDKTLAAGVMTALGGVQVARDFLGADDAETAAAVKTLRMKIVARLEPAKVEVKA